MSDYVASIRSRIGNDLLLLPGVTAVIREDDRFLLARHHSNSDRWSLIGGGVEPGEEPTEALAREVLEEIGATIRIRGIVGAYGGRPLTTTYPNGHQVGYVTVAYDCELLTEAHPDLVEVSKAEWFPLASIGTLPRQAWIDRVIIDTAPSSPGAECAGYPAP